MENVNKILQDWAIKRRKSQMPRKREKGICNPSDNKCKKKKEIFENIISVILFTIILILLGFINHS